MCQSRVGAVWLTVQLHNMDESWLGAGLSTCEVPTDALMGQAGVEEVLLSSLQGLLLVLWLLLSL